MRSCGAGSDQVVARVCDLQVPADPAPGKGADEAEIGVLLRLSGFRWAAEGLQLREQAPVLAPAAITRLVQDLKKVAPRGEHTTIGEAGIAMLGARNASAETRESITSAAPQAPATPSSVKWIDPSAFAAAVPLSRTPAGTPASKSAQNA